MAESLSSQEGKEVTFGDLTIREYPIILGDNPACTGVPITIDWDYYADTGTTRNLELYEYIKAKKRRRRNKANNTSNNSAAGINNKSNTKKDICLRIPVTKRSQMLLDAGYTQNEILQCALEVLEIQKQRAESRNDQQQQQQKIKRPGFGKSLSVKNFFNKLKIIGTGVLLVPTATKPPTLKATPVTARTA